MLWSDVRIANRCGYLVLVDTASQISRELTRCFVSLPNVSTDIYSCRISAAWKCFRGDIRVNSGLCGWDDTMDRFAGARPCGRRFAGDRFRAQSWICRHNGFGFSRHSLSRSFPLSFTACSWLTKRVIVSARSAKCLRKVAGSLFIGYGVVVATRSTALPLRVILRPDVFEHLV